MKRFFLLFLFFFSLTLAGCGGGKSASAPKPFEVAEGTTRTAPQSPSSKDTHPNFANQDHFDPIEQTGGVTVFEEDTVAYQAASWWDWFYNQTIIGSMLKSLVGIFQNLLWTLNSVIQVGGILAWVLAILSVILVIVLIAGMIAVVVALFMLLSPATRAAGLGILTGIGRVLVSLAAGIGRGLGGRRRHP